MVIYVMRDSYVMLIPRTKILFRLDGWLAGWLRRCAMCVTLLGLHMYTYIVRSLVD